MKVTLIYPGIVRIGFNSLGKGGMDRNWINLGLAYIGAYLVKHSYDVDLLDLREMTNWEHVEAEIGQRDPDVLGVYFNTPNYGHALRCCQIAKELGKTTVAGGPHASIDPDNLIKTGYVDHVIVGEGEVSFVELLDKLKTNANPAQIIQGKTVDNLDDLLFPARDLYNLAKINNPIGNYPFIDNGYIILTSRGCPFNCSFCQPLARKMFGRKVRYRSIDSVMKELKYIVEKYKTRYISFQDDTFTTRKEWVLELCERIKEEKLGIQWSAQSRADTFDEDLARNMSEAGCVCLFFGFESGSERVLEVLRKGIKPEQSIEASRLCRKYGILILGDFMIGIPSETEDDLKQTLNLVKRIRAEIFSVTYFTPIPGCDLYDYCKENNLITIQGFEQYTRNPEGEKVAGVDYSLVKKYKKKMEGRQLKWWQEKHLAKLAIRRWRYLLKHRYFYETFYEFIRYSIPGWMERLAIVRYIKNIIFQRNK